MDIKELLTKTGLFSELSEQELQDLTLTLSTVTFSTDQIILKQGDLGDVMYVILSGFCQVYVSTPEGEDIILARLEPGQYFGEQALLNETPGRRNANVKALNDVELVKISHSNFQSVLRRDQTLKTKLQVIGAKQLQFHFNLSQLHKVYQSRQRGEIRQYHGEFLNQPAIINNFVLDDGREFFSARINGQNLLAFQDAKSNISGTVKYEQENKMRELVLDQHTLIGVSSYGDWEFLPKIIQMIFNRTPLDRTQMDHFEKQGELTVVLPQEAISPQSDNEIICNCMYISLGEIKEKIKLGCLALDNIGDTTGAGTVCGTCRPKIQEILGNSEWQTVRIRKVTRLTQDIHAYDLISALGEPLAPHQTGQYIMVQCYIRNNWISRAYTLTSNPEDTDHYEIAILRVSDGMVSNWIFNHEGEIPLLRVSRPYGKFIPDLDTTRPLLCIMGGIGITPAVAFARTAYSRNSPRPILIYFSAHHQDAFAYLEELQRLSRVHPKISVYTRSTDIEGRLQESDIALLVHQYHDADFFLCGPSGFQTDIVSYLKNNGVHDERIFIEKFTSASQVE